MSDEDGGDRFWKSNRLPYLGEPLIDPRTGELRDYRRFPGDNPPQYFQGEGAEADRWGNRILMEINQPDGAHSGPVDTQPLVDIRTLAKTVPIDLQLRFALPDASGSPILPFSTVWPFTGGGEQLVVTVRRTADPLSAPTEDTLTVTDQGSRVFPWDIFTSRTFNVQAAFSDAFVTGLPQKVWVEAIATQVTDIASRSEIQGWGLVNQQTFVPANLANVQLLQGRADRRQFIICNTSTAGNLYINFNNIASATTPQAVMVLPAGSFATYEAPPGGFTGNVFGVWDDDTDGGALVTDGVYGSPSTVVF